MDKENSNYAFKVVREATIRADIDAKGLSIPHTLETSGYRPDGELTNSRLANMCDVAHL